MVATNMPSLLNSVNFLAVLSQKLPTFVWDDWVSKALEIEQCHGHLAAFNDFAEFVINESTKASSTYYKALFPGSQKEKSDSKSSFKLAKLFAISASTSWWVSLKYRS